MFQCRGCGVFVAGKGTAEAYLCGRCERTRSRQQAGQQADLLRGRVRKAHPSHDDRTPSEPPILLATLAVAVPALVIAGASCWAGTLHIFLELAFILLLQISFGFGIFVGLAWLLMKVGLEAKGSLLFRAVCLLVMAIGWVLSLITADCGTETGDVLFVGVGSPLLAAGTVGIVVGTVRAFFLGNREAEPTSQLGGPVPIGYRISWALGAVLLLPLVVPYALSLALGLLMILGFSPVAGGNSSDRSNLVILFVGFGLLGLVGLLLACAKPRPPSAPKESPSN